MTKLVRILSAVIWLVIVPRGSMFAVPPIGSSASSHYEHPSTKGGPYHERVVVFVHGIFGDADSTWRSSSSVYWPRLLLTDLAFQDSDVYVASYSSPYLGNTMNVDEVVTNLNNRLVSDEIFSKHHEVVFVYHSLGGLIVQRLLLTYRQYAQQVPFIYFFSTPETGSQIATLGSLFSSDPLLQTMFFGDENSYLQNLENEWKAAQFHIHRLCAYEKKKYMGVLVVDRLSGTRNCDEPPIAINENHDGIVKPGSVEHDSYIALRNAIRAYPVSPKPKIPPSSGNLHIRGSELNKSALQTEGISLQFSCDFWPLKIAVPPGKTISILRFTDSLTDELMQFTNTNTEPYLWPESIGPLSPDLVWQCQIRNISASKLYNCQPDFKAEFDAGQPLVVVKAILQRFFIDVDSGDSYRFYAVNMSKFTVVLNASDSVLTRVIGKQQPYKIPLTGRSGTPADRIPITLFPTGNKWEGTKIVGPLDKQP